MVGRWFDMVRLRLRSIFRGARLDAELDRELRSHIELEIEENVARGLSPDDARYAARRAFGAVGVVKEETRDARGVTIIDNLARDLRYTLRGLRREPMLLVAATISIALGVGGNIALFSLANELVFSPPHARAPRELVQMTVSHGSHVSYRHWLDLEASGALAQLTGYSIERQLNWLNGEAAVSVTPMLVTANFFDVTGMPLAMGRGFSADEARAERDPRLVVVSHAFWRRELGSDSAVVGRSIVLNGAPYTVVGVLAPRLRSVVGFGIAPSVYVPINRSLVPELRVSESAVVQLLGRLKPGQSLAQGRAAVDAADRRLGRLAGDTLYAGVQNFARAGGLSTGKAVRVVGAFLLLLALVSLFVLFIACANVAGLLIARVQARRQEIAVRLALGGTRSRLLQQFLIEGFWLALLGTTFGMGLAGVFMRVANGLTLPVALPIELHLSPDPAVILCALGLLLLSMLLSALLPALGATRLTLTPALKREEPELVTRRVTARGALLVGQVTVSTVLLVTAFLFVSNLARARVTNTGFEVKQGIIVQIGFVQGGAGGSDRTTVLASAVDRVRALPGVENAAFASGVPLTMHSGSHNGGTAYLDGRPEGVHVEYVRNLVGPGYFSTLGIRLRQGREFASSDAVGGPAVGIVNEEFVRRHFAGGEAIGRTVRFEGAPSALEIVGVVANSKYGTIGEEQPAALYEALAQHPAGRDIAFVLVRARSDPSALVRAVRLAVAGLDRTMAVEAQPMRSALAFALLPSRIGAAVLGTLGFLGLVLAMFGLYAIVSYNVSRRTREIAIRSALGAGSGTIVRLVVGDASLLVGIGVALGLGVSALVTQPLAAFLVAGLSTTDPASFAGTAAAFLLVAVLASWLPARHATRVSPVIAMRLD